MESSRLIGLMFYKLALVLLHKFILGLVINLLQMVYLVNQNVVLILVAKV